MPLPSNSEFFWHPQTFIFHVAFCIISMNLNRITASLIENGDDLRARSTLGEDAKPLGRAVNYVYYVVHACLTERSWSVNFSIISRVNTWPSLLCGYLCGTVLFTAILWQITPAYRTAARFCHNKPPTHDTNPRITTQPPNSRHKPENHDGNSSFIIDSTLAFVSLIGSLCHDSGVCVVSRGFVVAETGHRIIACSCTANWSH